MNKTRILLLILLSLSLFFLIENQIYAQEKTIFKTSDFTFNSIDNNYIFNVQIFKKAFKNDVFYEFNLRLESKIFLNIIKSKFFLNTEKKDILLCQENKSYKSWFDKEKNLWNEQIVLKCKYNDFELFLKSSVCFILIKSYSLNIKAEFPTEIKKSVLNLIEYSKEIGQDVTKQYQPFLFLGLVNQTIPFIFIRTAVFSSFNIIADTLLQPINDPPFVFSLLTEFYSFQLSIPFKFLIFSALNLEVFVLSYPFRSENGNETFLFNIYGIFAGTTINFFTLFKFIRFSASILPGLFLTFIYDENENSLMPLIDSSTLLTMTGAKLSFNIDIILSTSYTLTLMISTRFNFAGVIFNSIDMVSVIGF